MLAIASASISPPAGTQAPRKLRESARQFEALLLNTLLGPLEKTFSSVPGQKDVPGASDYGYMATQALSSAMAAAGGLGIARMIVHNIMLRQPVTDEPGAKVSASPSR